MLRILVTLALAFGLSSALACTVASVSSERVVAEAHTIFRARITEVKLLKTFQKEMLEVRFELNEKFKGLVPEPSVVRARVSQPGECGAFFIMTGVEYVIVMDSVQNPEISVRSFPIAPDLPGLNARLDEFRRIISSK